MELAMATISEAPDKEKGLKWETTPGLPIFRTTKYLKADQFSWLNQIGGVEMCNFDIVVEDGLTLSTDENGPRLLRADIGSITRTYKIRVSPELNPGDKRLCLAIDVANLYLSSADITKALSDKEPCRNQGQIIKSLHCPLCGVPGAVFSKDNTEVKNRHPEEGEMAVWKNLDLFVDGPVKLLATCHKWGPITTLPHDERKHVVGTLAQLIVMEPDSSFRMVLVSRGNAPRRVIYCSWDGFQVKIVRNDKDEKIAL